MKARFVVSLLLLASCASEAPAPSKPPEHADGVAAVTTETRSEESATAPSDPASPAAPAPAETMKTTAPRDPRVDRERLVERAADEDRPAGSSQVVVEPEGTFQPKYSVRTVERKDGPGPDSGVMKFVPGNNVSLPPPAPAEQGKVQATNQPEPTILVPREAK
ncbi:MAG TPA: hypothetical protein VFF73_17215 [Planctomycetota bacterium]|nr:hypothetical protein [Planctomycetota bacterium]